MPLPAQKTKHSARRAVLGAAFSFGILVVGCILNEHGEFSLPKRKKKDLLIWTPHLPHMYNTGGCGCMAPTLGPYPGEGE